MPDSRQFLHPEAIRRISRLELRARHIVEGFLSGMHRSPYFGHSVEFAQHREYVPGDDLRDIDWKVWAKQDRLYIKQYEEETNMRCMLLVDVSGSMEYGRGALNKFEYASTAAVSLAYLILRQQDAVGCICFDSKIRLAVPPRSKRTHLLSIIQALESCRAQDTTDLYHILAQVAQNQPRRGMIVLFSDLLVQREPLLRGLRMLRQRGHDVLVLHIMDDDELDFPFSGPMRFEGLEGPEYLNCNPRALRQGYLEALNQHLEQIRRGCARHTIDYALIRTSEPLDAALAHFLCNRLGMHHRN